MCGKAVVRQLDPRAPYALYEAVSLQCSHEAIGGTQMLDRWFNMRLRCDWASQACARGIARIDAEAIAIGAALLTYGLLRF